MGCFEGEWRLNQRYAYIRNFGYFGMTVWIFFAARAFNKYSYWHSSTYLLSILKITPNEGIVTKVKIMLPLPPPKFYEPLCHRKKKKRRSTKWGAKITFRHGILIPFIQFGQNFAWKYYLTHSTQTSLCKNFSFITKYKMAHKSHFSSSFESRSSDYHKIKYGHTSWPYKQFCTRIYHLTQNPRWLLEVKGPKSFGWKLAFWD